MALYSICIFQIIESNILGVVTLDFNYLAIKLYCT